jgi:hypothetical protein
MRSDEELMTELSAGVQKIFEDAVNRPPFIADGNGKKGDES